MWLEIHNVVTKIINSMAVSKQFTDFLSYFSQKFSHYCFLSPFHHLFLYYTHKIHYLYITI